MAQPADIRAAIALFAGIALFICLSAICLFWMARNWRRVRRDALTIQQVFDAGARRRNRAGYDPIRVI